MLLMIDVDTDKGGMTLNSKFSVDFRAEPDSPSGPLLMKFDIQEVTALQTFGSK